MNLIKKNAKSKLYKLIDKSKKDVGYLNYLRSDFSLNDIKIIEKHDIQENEKEFINKKELKSGYSIKKTSGSTGEPLNIYKTKNDMLTQNFVFWRHRYPLGINPSNSKILYCYLNAENPFTRANGYYQINSKEFSFNLNCFLKNSLQCKQIIDKIYLFKPNLIIMPPSAVQAIVLYCMAHKLYKAFESVKLVELISEPILPGQKNDILNFFNKSKVVSQYGCSEVGFIGIDNKLNGRYIIDNTNVFVETNVNGKIGKNYGKFGNIVLTGLNSYGMPFIRYQMEDIIRLECKENKEYLEILKGRKNDLIIISKYKKIHSSILSKIIEKVNEKDIIIKKYKFTQQKNNIMLLEIYTDPSLNKYKIKKEVIKVAKSYKELAQFNWKIDFISDWRKFNQNGKLKYFESKI